MSENNTTRTFVKTIVDVTECPLCSEMLQGRLTNLVEMPTDKLGDVGAVRTQMKMTAVSFDLLSHSCERVEQVQVVEQPEFRQRGGGLTITSDQMRFDINDLVDMPTARPLWGPTARRGGARYGR